MDLKNISVDDAKTTFEKEFDLPFNVFIKIYEKEWLNYVQKITQPNSIPSSFPSSPSISPPPLVLVVPPVPSNTPVNNVVTKSEQPEPQIKPIITTPEPNAFISTHSGIYGEKEIIDLILRVKPKFEVIRVGSTGHMADIHVTDFENSIKYIVEVKNKKIITKEDVDKFDRDLLSLSTTENNIVGLFLCLEADNIPSIGNFQISKTKIYLTKNFINTESLELIFSYVPLLNCIQTPKTDSVKYEIPQNVYNLLAQLQHLQQETKNEISTLQLSNTSLSSVISSNALIIASMITRDKIMSEIVREFSKEINIFKIQTQNIEQQMRIRQLLILTVLPPFQQLQQVFHSLNQ